MWCGGWRIIPARAGFTTVTPDQSAPNSDHPRSRGVYSGRPTGSRRSRDHPRSRGVYMASRRLISSMMGSSPLARGLLAQEGGLLGGGRIIPARAGFTLLQSMRVMSPWGSSPLARGLRGSAAGSSSGERIIPARAGFTCSPAGWTVTPRDHPRSRGVYSSRVAFDKASPGSSPLARGLPSEKGLFDETTRIIPARAGFTHDLATVGASSPDHPRSRGVYGSPPVSRFRVCGSSPLARGLLLQPPDNTDASRIIPARAGFTRGRHEPLLKNWDHPRSRGVYNEKECVCRFIGGSSPLARGLPDTHIAGLPRNRIIPARAGFTRRRSTGPGSARDHPRSRGVYPTTVGQQGGDAGSSPLARGLRTSLSGRTLCRRIIPARAGFTYLSTVL